MKQGKPIPASTWLPKVIDQVRNPPQLIRVGPLTAALGGGLAPCQEFALGGASETGKSLLVLNAALDALKSGAVVVLADLENGRTRLTARFFDLMGISLSAVARRPTGSSTKTERAVGELWRRFFVVEPRDVDELVESVATVRRKAGRNHHLLVIVDSLQKLVPFKRDRRGDIDEACIRIERMKHDERCAVILVSEVGRSASNGDDPFKESTEIKYSADVAASLSKSRLRIVKDRDGRCRRKSFSVRLRYPTFEFTSTGEAAPSVDPAAALRMAVLAFVRDAPAPVTAIEVRIGVGKREEDVRDALKGLVDDGELRRDKQGRTERFSASQLPGASGKSTSTPSGACKAPRGERRT